MRIRVVRIRVLRIIVIVIIMIILIVIVSMIIIVIVVMLVDGLERSGLRLLLGHGFVYVLGIDRPHGREGFGALAALVSAGGGARFVLEPIWLRRIG